MTDIYLSRQPIFHRNMQVYAYELQYRSCESNSAEFDNPDLATIQVTLNTIIEVGLNNIVGKSIAVINLTRNFLIGKHPILLPHDRIMIEIPETINIDEELLRALLELRRAGFTIALDNVMELDRIIPFQNIAAIVKLDIKQIDNNLLPTMIKSIKKRGFQVLVEKVETITEFTLCHDLGVDYFQGDFLCKPNIIHEKKMESSRIVVMRSLALLQDQKATFSDIEQIVAQDVSLCYKLLRLTNSGYYSFISEVKSIRQAVSLIGLDTIRGWLSLLLMSNLNDKPLELTNLAMQRAHMAELLAKVFDYPQPEICFLVGLFSLLDALMDQPLDKIVADLNLTRTLADALLYYEGVPGYILKLIKSYELGEWSNLDTTNPLVKTISQVYLESVKWTNLYSADIHDNVEVVSY
jgi:c-di-GMP phosphodiesterase